MATKTAFWLPEIVRRIRVYSDQPGFAALCRTSRHIHHVGDELLYENVSLVFGEERDYVTFATFLRTLLEAPEVALWVKTFRLEYRHPYNVPIMLPNNKPFRPKLISSIIPKLPNLRSLTMIDRVSGADPIDPRLERAFALVRSLRHLEIELTRTWWATWNFGGIPLWPNHLRGQLDINGAVLVHALRKPALKSLSLTLQEGEDSLLWATRLPKSTSIVSLDFKGAILGMHTLGNIIFSTPCVKHLTLDLVVYADPLYPHLSSLFKCDELEGVLVLLYDTLETLKINVEFRRCTDTDVSDLPTWGPSGAIEFLKACTRLRSLELPVEFLLGWEKNDEVELAARLPNSLERLCFSGEFEDWMKSPWDIKTLGPKLLAYLGNKSRAPLKALGFTGVTCDMDANAPPLVDQVIAAMK